ncbi:MAG: GNAT family N-acetyltransferase [Endomicrobiaceae bacterium]|nr:GNAT family N-acetyltransferase [Endomicrobiaceae bacterium]
MGSEIFDYVDVIYNTTEESVLRFAFNLLFSELKKEGFEKLYFKFIPDNLSCKTLKEYKNFYYMESVKSVNVNFISWDTYFSGLSKSQRQNIRTAYNRLNRENKSFSFLSTTNNQQATALYNKCFKLYMKRQATKYGAGLKELLFYKYFHYMSQCALTDINFAFAFVIEKEIASVMIGFFDPVRNAVEISILAVNDKYLFYSPGVLLICETIKHLTANTDYKNLDLCIGVEKYKNDMGGEIYYTHNFFIKL